MMTSHRADGPGSRVRPGPGDFVARAANDNDPNARHAPITGIRGLVLAFEAGEEGVPRVAIRAMDEAGALAPALHVAHEPDDVIALWRGLGRDLNLPLFILDIRGEMTPITSMLPDRPFARRKGSPLSGRRPRFLARRRPPLPAYTGGQGKTARTEG